MSAYDRARHSWMEVDWKGGFHPVLDDRYEEIVSVGEPQAYHIGDTFNTCSSTHVIMQKQDAKHLARVERACQAHDAVEAVGEAIERVVALGLGPDLLARGIPKGYHFDDCVFP